MKYKKPQQKTTPAGLFSSKLLISWSSHATHMNQPLPEHLHSVQLLLTCYCTKTVPVPSVRMGAEDGALACSLMFITSHFYRPHRYQIPWKGRRLRGAIPTVWLLCVLFSEHVLLLNWLISEVWAAVSINCYHLKYTHPKKYQQESLTKWKSTRKTQYLMNLQQFFKICASSQVSAALLGLSTSMYTNIIATVTTVTATPRHIGLTSWNRWTIKAGKDLLDHCVQLLPKSPNHPCLGMNTHYWVSSPAP